MLLKFIIDMKIWGQHYHWSSSLFVVILFVCLWLCEFVNVGARESVCVCVDVCVFVSVWRIQIQNSSKIHKSIFNRQQFLDNANTDMKCSMKIIIEWNSLDIWILAKDPYQICIMYMFINLSLFGTYPCPYLLRASF